MTSVTDLQRARAQSRLKLFQPTTLQLAGEEARAHILDLSATGALVHCAAPPPAAARIRIGCGGAPRAARVVWARGTRFGIVFAVPLTAADIEAALAGPDG